MITSSLEFRLSVSSIYFYYSNNNRSRTVFVVSENLELRHAPCPRTLSPPTYVGPSHVCENDFSHEAKRKRREEEGEKERRSFRRSLARNTRSGLHGVSCYSCFDDRNSFRSLFSRHSSSLEMFPQKMGFYKHEIGPSNSEW